MTSIRTMFGSPWAALSFLLDEILSEGVAAVNDAERHFLAWLAGAHVMH